MITNVISTFNPISKMVSELSVNESDKLKLRSEFNAIQDKVTQSFVEYESQLLTARKNVVLSETTGQSWLQEKLAPDNNVNLFSISRL